MQNLTAAHEHMKVYTEQSFPLNYTESGEDGAEVIGYATDLVRAILRKSKLEHEITIVPWRRAMQAIDSRKNVLVYSMTRSVDRENKYHWIGEILPIKYSLYGLAENLAELPRTLAEARNMRVGVNRGDVISAYLESVGFTSLTTVSDSARNLFMVTRGRIDLFPYSEFGFDLFAKRHGFDSGLFVPVMRLNEISTGIYLALSKSTDRKIVLKLKNAYTDIKNSGEYHSIMAPMLEVVNIKD